MIIDFDNNWSRHVNVHGKRCIDSHQSDRKVLSCQNFATLAFDADNRYPTNSTTVKRYHMHVHFLLLIIALVFCSVSVEAAELEFSKMTVGKIELQYTVVVPDDFDSSQEYPILVALPPGAQNKQMVQASFNLYWNAGKKNGWIVVSPAAPDGKFFNQGSEDLIPGFLEEIKKSYKPEGGKFYLAGISNGGTSLFRVAGKYPQLFQSLMAMPGFAAEEVDKKNLAKVKDMPIAMYVGKNDARWVREMEKTAESLKELKANVTFEIVPDQGHVIQGWQDGKKVFGVLNNWREKAKAAK